MNKEKMKKYIVIIPIVIIIICVIIFLKLNQKYTLEYINNPEIEVEKGTVFADNIVAFFAYYKGNVSPETVYKSMYNACKNVIPKLYKDLKGADENTIEKYYNKNSKYLVEILGIDNLDDFKALIKKLNTFKGETIAFEAYSVDMDSFNHTNKRSTMDLDVKYSDSNKLELKLTVKRNTSDNSSAVQYRIR